MFSHHELVASNPEMFQSQDNRKTYCILSAVGFPIGLYFLYLAGCFESPTPTIGMFPGGEFVFKSETRDYAASGGLYREFESILKDTKEECFDPYLGEPSRYWDHTIHSFYLDDPALLPYNVLTRYAVGALLHPKQKHLKKKILESNTNGRSETGGFESITIPKGKAAVLKFPNRKGLFSLLLFPYKVVSPLMKFIQSNTKGEDSGYPLIITRCHKDSNMCTHYAPLKDNKKYFLGKVPTKKYITEIGVDQSPFWDTWIKMKELLGVGGSENVEL